MEGGRLLVERYGEQHPEVALAASYLAEITVKDDPEVAARIMERAVGDLRNSLGPEDRRVMDAAVRLGKLYSQAGENGLSEETLRDGLTVMDAALGPDDPLRYEALKALGETQQFLAKLEEARQTLERAARVADEIAVSPREAVFRRIADEIASEVSGKLLR